jgi:hypothetical protein
MILKKCMYTSIYNMRSFYRRELRGPSIHLKHKKSNNIVQMVDRRTMSESDNIDLEYWVARNYNKDRKSLQNLKMLWEEQINRSKREEEKKKREQEKKEKAQERVMERQRAREKERERNLEREREAGYIELDEEQ